MFLSHLASALSAFVKSCRERTVYLHALSSSSSLSQIFVLSKLFASLCSTLILFLLHLPFFHSHLFLHSYLVSSTSSILSPTSFHLLLLHLPLTFFHLHLFIKPRTVSYILIFSTWSFNRSWAGYWAFCFFIFILFENLSYLLC